MTQRQRRRHDGYILLASLWLVMLLALTATAVVRAAHSGAAVAQNVSANRAARYLADGAIDAAIFDLLTAPPTANAALAAAPPFDGGLGSIALRIVPEAAKVDLNRAPSALIEALLREAGISGGDARRLVAQLEDWRDQDDEPAPQGAEHQAYRDAGKTGPANRPLIDWREIGELLDAPDDLTARLEGLVTVHGGPGIDPGFAATAVTRAAAQLNPKPEIDSRALGVFSIHATVDTPGGGHVERHAVLRLMPGHTPPYRLLALN
ncbi:MAG: hypothetical protein Tsb0016_10280 [Sphingomonadales bacterium]